MTLCEDCGGPISEHPAPGGEPYMTGCIRHLRREIAAMREDLRPRQDPAPAGEVIISHAPPRDFAKELRHADPPIGGNPEEPLGPPPDEHAHWRR